MPRLLLTRVTKLRGRAPHEMYSLEQMQEEDPSVVSVEVDHTRTVITTTWDAFKQMEFFLERGLIDARLDLMQMINNWRRYNELMREYVTAHERYYKSKNLYWRWEY